MPFSAVAKHLRAAKHVVVFTGAGASAESGIPTFRDALTGLWETSMHRSSRQPKRSVQIQAFAGDGTSGVDARLFRPNPMERITQS
jgi:NAD-dependent SIR2 family protein deacetylase